MRFCIILMAAIVLFLLAGVIPAPNGEALPQLFYSPVFIALGFVIGIGNLVVLIKRWKKLGFVLMHLGVTVLLIGGFIGHLRGTKGSMVVYLNAPPQNTMRMKDGSEITIPISVEALNFKVEHYPPNYVRYTPVASGNYVPAASFTLDTESESTEVEGFGPVKLDLFRMGRMWLPRVELSDGSILVQQSMTPKRYETLLRFDGELEESVIINYPVTYKGWRFYLMSYDTQRQQYVVLTARHDPGRPLVVAGIWMLIVGTFVNAFYRGGRHA
jgi:hypothetical protein